MSADMDAILKTQGLADGTVGARAEAGQRSGAAVSEYGGGQEGHAGPLPGDPRRGQPGHRRRLRRASEAGRGSARGTGVLAGDRPWRLLRRRLVRRLPSGRLLCEHAPRAETPKFAMRTLAYHEGIPGHHFQVAIAQELENVPFFRRVIPFTAYQEGWALYSERLAFEMGFGRDPLDSLGRLRDEMMRATRLVVDSGLHYKHWTREQAITYMMDNTGMSEGDVTAEVERYMVDPGQALAYKTGMLKILALREHAKQELGAKFDLKQFHNEVLTHGSLPLTLLEGVVNDWIAKRKKA
ncbi:DUF885 domain-containing protein [Massilia sp. B-10]|nr:DUF885 domain-containing protein [Massilia sp. B-10]